MRERALHPLRMFAAIEPAAAAIADLQQAVRRLRELEPDLRWTPPEQWHVTLVFAAVVPRDRVVALVTALEHVAASQPPLGLRIAGGGAFRRPAAARTIWAGLDGDLDALAALAAACQAAARSCRIEISEAAAFRPHLTLARTRAKPIHAGRLLQTLGPYAGPAWTADHITLIDSIPFEGGRHHATRAVLPLRGPLPLPYPTFGRPAEVGRRLPHLSRRRGTRRGR